MPELKLELHELWDRQKEIPDVDDCYLVDIRDADGNGAGADQTDYSDNPIEDAGVWPCPYFARAFPPLRGARDIRKEDFDDQWGRFGLVRIGYNTKLVTTPVTVTFRWGEGPQKIGGIEYLLHESAHNDVMGRFCKWCHGKQTPYPEDCPTRRLLALVDALRLGTPTDIHRAAVEKWHRKRRR